MIKKILAKVTHISLVLRGFLPYPLPIGMREFNLFADRIFKTYNIPSLPSYKHAIAAMIQHLGPQTHSAPLRYFACAIKKGQANQVAYAVIQAMKEEMAAKEAEEKAAAAAKLVVATQSIAGATSIDQSIQDGRIQSIKEQMV